jgi:predicted small integral membrane protein
MSVVMRKESRLPALRTVYRRMTSGKRVWQARIRVLVNAGHDTYPIELGGVRVLQARRAPCNVGLRAKA